MTELQRAALKAEGALADLMRLADLWEDEKRAVKAALETARRLSR